MDFIIFDSLFLVIYVVSQVLYLVNFFNRYYFIFVNFFLFVVKWSILFEDDVIFVLRWKFGVLFYL